MGLKKSDLLPRVLTAVIAVPLLLALVFLAPAWGFFILVAVAAAISIWEYCSITYGDEHVPARWLTAAVGVGLINVLYFAPGYFLNALTAAALVLMLFFLFTYRDQHKVSQQLGSSITAVIYGAVMLSTLGLLDRDAHAAGPYWVVTCFVVVWSSDTGAYFSGILLGKHKLYPAVSPNKSVEGAIGGLVASVGGAFACNYGFAAVAPHAWSVIPVWQVLVLAIPANILGQCGDLVESLIKRCHDVKDSGVIIYGHGGILDRIDALIFAAPWFYYFFARIR